MNICFFIAKIIDKIDFKFITNNKKYYSIAIFQIELDNKSIVTVKGYNEIADWCYKNLIKKDYIAVYGKINSEMEIVLIDIEAIFGKKFEEPQF